MPNKPTMVSSSESGPPPVYTGSATYGSRRKSWLSRRLQVIRVKYLDPRGRGH
jgi:hypothetical protein